MSGGDGRCAVKEREGSAPQCRSHYRHFDRSCRQTRMGDHAVVVDVNRPSFEKQLDSPNIRAEMCERACRARAVDARLIWIHRPDAKPKTAGRKLTDDRRLLSHADGMTRRSANDCRAK